jgi:anti-sigma B factor antagonist
MRDAVEVRQETRGGRLVLTPGDSLMSGGRAEQFEDVLQEAIGAGNRDLIVDLHHVRHADSGGIRALVRGHLSVAQKGGRVSLVNVPANVERVLQTLRLDSVFPIYKSIEAAVGDVAGT